MRLLIVAFVYCALLSACAHYSLVSPDRQPIGEVYSVETSVPWSRAEEGGMEVWTIDGPILQSLRFVTLNDGDALFPSAGKNAKLPRFKSHMTPSEVQEFFIASLRSFSGGIDTHMLTKGLVDPKGIRAASINASSIEARNLRPADFGSLPGFRFDFQFLSKQGLKREGLALGAIHNGKLHLIMYTGTKEYYFEKYKREVESILASVQIRK